jgi:molecular chaperone HtpG
MEASLETLEFQTEARQLLDLMIHSVYSNKDIFLRELISNASDALDRRRFEALSNPALLPADVDLMIRIEPDKQARTLTVSDTGIGMSRDEVVTLIGTIAKSGTREFIQKAQAAKQTELPPELIGQFGVGFYSAFMVADTVSMTTRRAGEDRATRFESRGEGTYTLEEADRAQAGTTLTLHLKPADSDDALHDYTDPWVIKSIVKKYSDFVSYPIKMQAEKKVTEEGTERTVVEDETLNSMKALWLRSREEVSQDELHEFYKHISHDWNPPLETIWTKMEGTLEYRLLLFIPSRAPFDLFYRDGKHGIHLYVKRVFIMEDCQALLPDYLRFVRGVVDSEDLSLNISRELLQQDRQIQRIRKGVISKILDSLKKMMDNEPEKYHTFWNEFGRVMKEGIFADRDQQAALLDLMLCRSTMSDGNWTTLREYVTRMKPDQNVIYYMTGDSLGTVQDSPHLEAFRDKGYEVLLFNDPVDEVWVQSVLEYDGKRMQSAGKGDVELGSDEEKKQAAATRDQRAQEFQAVLDTLKSHLGEQVKEVRLSTRLRSSAACLVGEAGDMSPQLEQMMKALGQELPQAKRVLEVNPDHPLLEKLRAAHAADQAAADLSDYAELLYGQAVLAEGGELPNPSRFSKLVADVMAKAL